MDRKRLLIVSTVIVFSTLLWWLSTTLNLPDRPIVTGTPATPDYTIDEVHVVKMNKSGEKNYSLSAKRMIHYASEKLGHLEKAYLVQYQPDGITIHTSSDTARYPDSGHELFMQDNVRIIRKRSGKILSEIRSNSTHIVLP